MVPGAGMGLRGCDLTKNVIEMVAKSEKDNHPPH